MIFCDSRIGSSHYAQYLGHLGEIASLDYGDIAFTGNGNGGEISIGIEIKKIADALSCMVDGRFTGHQVPGLVRTYDRCYLLVEGIWRPDPNSGVLQVGYGTWNKDKFGGTWKDASAGYQRFTHKQFTNWLETVSNMANIRVLRSNSELETVEFIKSLYGWWGKDWDDHHSLHTFHEERPDQALLSSPPLRVKIAAQLPNIGWTRGRAVAKVFSNTKEMIIADAKEWEQVEGVGPGISKKVWEAIRKG